MLSGELSDLSDVVVSLFFSDSRKAHGGLTTATVLLGQHDRKALQDFFRIALERGIQHSITVNDDEAELFVVLEESLEGFSVEPVLALVGELCEGEEGFNVNHHLLLGLAIVQQDHTTEQNEAIVRRLLVQL